MRRGAVIAAVTVAILAGIGIEVGAYRVDEGAGITQGIECVLAVRPRSGTTFGCRTCGMHGPMHLMKRYRLRLVRRSQGWAVRSCLKELRSHPANRRDQRRDFLSRLATPGRYSLLAAGSIGITAALGLLFLGFWFPHEGTPPVVESEWQVQAAIAAAALPILGLIIQLAGDQGQVAARTPEVLMRSSWAFILVALSLIGTLLIGWSTVFLPQSVAQWVARAILVLTVAGTLFAYYRSLTTLANPLRVREVANEIARSRIRESVRESAARRIANNRVLAALPALGVEYYPISISDDEIQDWHIVVSLEPQEVLDLNLQLLELVLSGLPSRATITPTLGALQPSSQPTSPVRLLRLAGQRTYAKDLGLLAIHETRWSHQAGLGLDDLLRRAFSLGDLR